VIVSRRAALKAMAAAAVGAPAMLRGRYRVFAASPERYSARAIRILESSLVIDMLNQFRFPDYAESPPRITGWLNHPESFTADDYAPYRDSRIDVFALGSGPAEYEAAVKFLADWNGFLATHSDLFIRVNSVDDIERAHRTRKVGILLTWQEAAEFRDADDVNTLQGLGLRVAQLTYNYANRIGSGFLEQRDGGLTVFGRSILKRMNDVGVAVDLSHCADQTTLDAIEASTKPVIFTHANCRALVPGHLRCKTDEAIRQMAITGGVMGISFLRFLNRAAEPVTIENVLDHIDHVTMLVGVEHVGIGSDLDIVGNPNPVNGPAAPDPPNFDRYRVHRDPAGRITIAGLDHPKRMFDLTEGLIRRSYSDKEIGQILGGNWARALTQIWTTR
jgi:membrane dipeptidase